jgi:hypothetical protein
MAEMSCYPPVCAYFPAGDAGLGKKDPALEGAAKVEAEQGQVEAHRPPR